jgi:hypothetical protein
MRSALLISLLFLSLSLHLDTLALKPKSNGKRLMKPSLANKNAFVNPVEPRIPPSDEDDEDEEETGFNPYDTAIRGLRAISDATFLVAKTSVDALAPKFISKKELLGTWRFEQCIENPDNGKSITEAVTICFNKNGTCHTRFRGKSYVSYYTFTQRSWPRHCILEFEAKTLRDELYDEPQQLIYRGHFKRSILNKKVISLRGTLFRLTGSLL